MSLAMLDRLVDWFIPAEIAGERESRQRARMFVISHLLGPFIGSTIPIYLYIFGLDQGVNGVIFWASMLAFWVYNPILKLTGRYMLLTLVSIQNFLFCVWWGWYHWGGISSPFLPWLAVTPILAFLYIGADSAARMRMLALIGANMALFFGFYFLRPPAEMVEPATMQMLGIVSTLAAAVYVSMMALYYAKILASQVELEAVMKGHLTTAAELRRATAEAERAGAAKAEFLAKMSHELRTPLNAVIGYSQMLLEDAQDAGEDADAADLEKIHSAGHHLLKLVNEVLDLSKIEAGKMELSTETMDVASFLTDVAESYLDAANAAGNSLAVHADRRLGTIVTDAKKLRQAVGQILDNAVKFTHAGRIDVSAKREPGAKGEEIVIRVRDTGIGIAPEALPSLFDKFSVADDTSASKYGGTGLGLALALKLCRLMNGDIQVESAPGAGSCFTLRIPTAPPAAATAPDADETADEALSDAA